MNHLELLESSIASMAAHAQLIERRIRGDLWAIISNEATGEQVRINEHLLRVVQALDAQQSIGAVLDQHAVTDPEERASIVQGLQTLLETGMLQVSAEQSTERLIAGRKRHRRSTGIGRLRNPLAVRIPLHDPHGWLDRLTGVSQCLFSKKACIVWLLLMSSVLISAIIHASDLANEFRLVLSNPGQWWFYILLYPLLKLIHESAHAVCVRHWGGQVNEMGISLLVLMPVPYVDASDAWMFQCSRSRMITSAAGMLAEITLAGMALILWCMIEPGVVRDVCFSLAVLGALPTLIFNANPLMKFDGYQILQDALDMPNLASRSSRYLIASLKRILFALESPDRAVTAKGEVPWLVCYGLAALAWRWVVTFSIVIWLCTHVAVVGVLLACFSIYQLLVRPVYSAVRWLRYSPDLEGARTRSQVVSAGVICALILFVSAVPLPSKTQTTGLVWAADQSEMLVPEAGEITQLHFRDGEQVVAGDAVAQLFSPELELQYQRKLAAIEIMRAKRRSVLNEDVVESRILREELKELQDELAQLAERLDRLKIRTRQSGRFVAAVDSALIGRFANKGEVLGHVVSQSSLRIRSVVEEAQFGRWLEGVTEIRVRLAERPAHSYPAQMVAQTPAANRTLPSPALAAAKGGGIAISRQSESSESGLQTLAPVFHVELAMPESVDATGIGGRAYVTFGHEAESLARRCFRRLRQLFLEQMSV